MKIYPYRVILLNDFIYSYLLSLSFCGNDEHSSASFQTTSNVSKKAVHSLLKIEFDGESHRSSSKHISHVILNYKYYKITNDLVKWILFSLTFSGRVKLWFESLLDDSIQAWEQFMYEFYNTFGNYDYDELCGEF